MSIFVPPNLTPWPTPPATLPITDAFVVCEGVLDPGTFAAGVLDGDQVRLVDSETGLVLAAGYAYLDTTLTPAVLMYRVVSESNLIPTWIAHGIITARLALSHNQYTYTFGERSLDHLPVIEWGRAVAEEPDPPSMRYVEAESDSVAREILNAWYAANQWSRKDKSGRSATERQEQVAESSDALNTRLLGDESEEIPSFLDELSLRLSDTQTNTSTTAENTETIATKLNDLLTREELKEELESIFGPIPMVEAGAPTPPETRVDILLKRVDFSKGITSVLEQNAPPITLGNSNTAVAKGRSQLGSLGYDVPAGADGTAAYDIGMSRAVKDFQTRNGLSATGLLDKATRDTLTSLSGHDGSVDTSYIRGRVVGKLILADGTPPPFEPTPIVLQVLARQPNGGWGTTPVAQAQPSANGDFQLSPTSTVFEARIFGRVGLSGDPHLIAELQWPRTGVRTLNLVAPTTLVTPSSAELSRLVAALASSGATIMNDLRHVDEDWGGSSRPGLAYWAEKTRWDPRILAVAARAAALKVQLDLLVETAPSLEALYGVLRVGLPSTKEGIARVHPNTFAAALTRATTSRLTALTLPITGGGSETEAFAEFVEDAFDSEKPQGAVSTLGEIFALAKEDEAFELDDDESGEQLETFKLYFMSARGPVDPNAATPPPEDFWGESFPSPEAAEPISAENKIRLQVLSRLAVMTEHNAPLMEAIAAYLGTEGTVSKRLQGLVAAGSPGTDFHKAATWAALAVLSDGENIPKRYVGSTSTRRDRYAAELAKQVRLSLPMQVVARELEAGALSELEDAEDVSKVLRAASAFVPTDPDEAGYRLGRGSLNRFLDEHREVLEDELEGDVTNFAGAWKGLERLHRLYQLAPSLDVFVALVNEGFESAHDIADVTRESLVVRLGRGEDAVMGERDAGTVHDKARQVVAVVEQTLTGLRQAQGAPSVAATMMDENVAKLIQQYPTIERLFGTTDSVECAECSSVLSPAAYLVDILSFTDPSEPVWEDFLARWKREHSGSSYAGAKPYDTLVGTELAPRRPDLTKLELSCDNIHTVVPQLDLVAEVLESAVTGSASTSPIGGATDEELLAEPQRVQDAAYEATREAKYPIGLPFDNVLASRRAYLNATGRSLSELMAVVAGGDEDATEDVLLEELGLARADLEIFEATFDQSTDPGEGAVWFGLAYGYETTWAVPGYTATTLETYLLTHAATLARRLGVTYQDLAELLGTSFVNPVLAEHALLRKVGVTFAQVRYYFQDASTAEQAAFEARLARHDARWGLTGTTPTLTALTTAWNATLKTALVLVPAENEAAFDYYTIETGEGTSADWTTLVRLNLFVRLWRKLGGSISEVDDLLRENGASSPSDLRDALLRVARERRVVKALGNVDAKKVRTFWRDLVPSEPRSLYERLFVPPGTRVSSPLDAWNGDYLATPATAAEHLPVLRATLGLRDDELTYLLGELSITSLTASTVSALVRHAVLTRALGLGARELRTAVALFGNGFLGEDVPAPFGTDAHENTLRFIQLCKGVRDAGLTHQQLAWIFKHERDASGPWQAHEAIPAAFFNQLIGELARITEVFDVTDPETYTEERLERTLETLLPPRGFQEVLAVWRLETSFRVESAALGGGDSHFDVATLDSVIAAAKPGLRSLLIEEDGDHDALTWTGVLTQELAEELKSAVDGSAVTTDQKVRFAQLADALVATSNASFREAVGDVLSGELQRGLSFFLQPPLGASEEAWETALNERRASFFTQVLPYFKATAVGNALVPLLASGYGVPDQFVRSLIIEGSGAYVRVGEGERSLSEGFTVSALAGLHARFVNSSGDVLGQTVVVSRPVLPLSGAIDPRSGIATSGPVSLPGGTATVEFEGFFKAAFPGEYTLDLNLGAGVGGSIEVLAPFKSATVAAGGAQTLSLVVDATDAPLSLLVRLTGDVSSGSAEIKLRVGSQGSAVPFPTKLARIVPHARAHVLFAKLALLNKHLGLDDEDLRSLTSSRQPVLAGATPSSRTPADAKLFIDYANLKKRFPAGQVPLRKLFRSTARWRGDDDNNPSTSPAAPTTPELATALGEAKDACAQLFDVDSTTVALVVDHLGIEAVSANSNWSIHVPGLMTGPEIERVVALLGAMKRYGTSIATLATWVNPNAEDGSYAQSWRSLRDALRARFDPAGWASAVKADVDALRQQRRNALVSYLVHTRELPGTEELYEWLLLDPLVEPVVETSRVQLAIASVQTFVQRVLMRLEPSVEPATLDGSQWEWMKSYRVWEAARKLFLYPENWLEPELRDDSSGAFRKLSSSIAKASTTPETLNAAVYAYVQDLDQLSQLEIVSLFVEPKSTRPGSSGDVLHLLARTEATPHKYFYRDSRGGDWSPWEELTVTPTSDSVVLAVWNNRPYVFWVTFKETPMESTSASAKVFVEYQVDWTSRTSGEWRSPTSSGIRFAAKSMLDAVNGQRFANIRVSINENRGALFLHVDEMGSAVTFQSGGRIPVPGEFSRAVKPLFTTEAERSAPAGELVKNTLKLTTVLLNEFREGWQSVPLLELKEGEGRVRQGANMTTTYGPLEAPFVFQDDEARFLAFQRYEPPATTSEDTVLSRTPPHSLPADWDDVPIRPFDPDGRYVAPGEVGGESFGALVSETDWLVNDGTLLVFDARGPSSTYPAVVVGENGTYQLDRSESPDLLLKSRQGRTFAYQEKAPGVLAFASGPGGSESPPTRTPLVLAGSAGLTAKQLDIILRGAR